MAPALKCASSHFDFEVPSHTPYIPGSGPPVKDPTLMLEHDKDGLITGEISLPDNRRRYVVTYLDNPKLIISVRPQNILDYVSPRTYEEYNNKIIDAQRIGHLKPVDDLVVKVKGKPRRQKKKSFPKRPNLTPAKLEPSSLFTTSPKINRRPLSQRKSGSEELLAFYSNKRPVLPSPIKQQVLAVARSDIKTEVEEVKDTLVALNGKSRVDVFDQAEESRHEEGYEVGFDNMTSTDAALATQFQGQKTKPGSGSSRLSIRQDRSSTASSEPSASPRLKKRPYFSEVVTGERAMRTSSRHSTSKSNYGIKRQKLNLWLRQGSVASSSSLEATAIYDDLEREDKNIPKKKITYTEKRCSTPATAKNANAIQKSATSKPQVWRNDEEYYEIECIEDDKVKKDWRGNPRLFYYIRWKGDYENSWEPEENVDSEAREEYHVIKALRKDSVPPIKRKVFLGDGSDEDEPTMRTTTKSKSKPNPKIKSNTKAVVELWPRPARSRTRSHSTSRINKSTTPTLPPAPENMRISVPQRARVLATAPPKVVRHEEDDDDTSELSPTSADGDARAALAGS